jgi:aminoacyl-tRNA hydrolase
MTPLPSLLGRDPRKSAIRLLKAARAGVRQLIWPVYHPTLLGLASAYRVQLRRTVFIGVTGSCGKTVTKDLIAAVLATRFQGRKSYHNFNSTHNIARALCRVRPWDRFCVLEISATVDGEPMIESSLRLARPQIGVVTNVGTDHISAFGSIDGIAAAKGRLIAALPPHGTAILNADDERVRAMQARCAGRVITYGLATDAMLRAEDVRASWPDRLSFTVHFDGETHAVRTQLCGAHWVSAVLAALAVGIAMGIPLAAAVPAIGTVRPYWRRMDPVSRPDGVTFIDDTAKAPSWTIPTALQFMKEAQAARKAVVIGTISDYVGDSDKAYVSAAKQALDAADRVVFVGPRASKCLKARRHAQDEALQAFYSAEAACEHLRDWLRPGDLVLLKASDRDELGRIIEGSRPAQGLAAAGFMPVGSAESVGPAQAVVGLGNPGERHRNTPHNIGHRALDLLAGSLAAEWAREDRAMVARVEQGGRSIYLIKPLTKINRTGPILLQLGRRLGFGPDRCILVHDDLDLSLGAVRVRMRGSDGGHRGVRSVLESFRTDELCRVKIGVGRPGEKDKPGDFVLTSLSPAEAPFVDKACAEAVERIRALLEAPARQE